MPPAGRARGISLTPWTVLPTLGHLCLLAFTLLLIIKLQGNWGTSWWWTFCPLWLFHALMTRCTCSMPAPATPFDRQWNPCHSLFTLPLILSFELLLCCYLSAMEVSPHRPPVPLAVVFMPLLLLEFAVLLDNFRMCIILMPGEEDNMTDEALWETLPHFAVAVSMVFFIAATIFTVLKLSNLQDELVDGIDWWTLLVDFCIGEFFAFLLCFKWTNPHHPSPPPPLPTPTPAPSASSSRTPLLQESFSRTQSHAQAQGGTSHGASLQGGSSREPGAIEPQSQSQPQPQPQPQSQLQAQSQSQSQPQAQLMAPSGGVSPLPVPRGEDSGGPRSPGSVASSDDGALEVQCGTAEFGGHLMKAGLIAFQVLLCMKLEGEPRWAAEMSLWALFSPLLLVQVLSLCSALLQLTEHLLLRYSADLGPPFSATVQEHDPFVFATKGMRLASWWCKEDEVREERKSLMDTLYQGYQTFEPTPSEYIKKMRKGDLKQEVLRLQAALVDQGETLKSQRHELDRIQQEKVLCRVCFDREISLVLLPCRHRVLCSACADKCKHCPICRRFISEKMAVFDV